MKRTLKLALSLVLLVATAAPVSAGVNKTFSFDYCDWHSYADDGPINTWTITHTWDDNGGRSHLDADTKYFDGYGGPIDGVIVDETDLFNDKLQAWEDFYNFNRPHGGLDGQTPYERLKNKTTESPNL